MSKTSYTVAIIWTVLVAIIPTVIGIMLLSPTSNLLAPGTQIPDLLRTIGYRNIVLSAVLIVALFTQPKRVVAFLLITRGLTEWADALSGVFVSVSFWAVPFIGGLGSLIAAYYFAKSDMQNKKATT